MTGAELKAWRERLGKGEDWGARVLGNVLAEDIDQDGEWGYRRLSAVEGRRRHFYGSESFEVFRTAYRAALEAEEASQRAQAEPVCPEGLKTWSACPSGTWVAVNGSHGAICVGLDGALSAIFGDGRTITPALLRYAADLSEYRARKHAEGDRQRKLDAVRAAEEAHAAACSAHNHACDRRRKIEREQDDECAATWQRFRDTEQALEAARREAGL